jgi:outer membrane protein W
VVVAQLPPSSPPAPQPVAPQPPVVTGGYTCFVGEHAGIDDADARTTTDLVCGELVLAGAPLGEYEVRFGKLGSRVLLGVRGRRDGAEDRRMLIQSFDEVPVAARRLVAAMVMARSVEQTQDVDNVVTADSRKTHAKSVAASGYIGLVGMMGAGVTPGASAGIDASLMFRNKRLALGGEVRGGGIGSSDDKLGFASADMVGRYYFNDGDVAPFLGGGLGLSYLKANTNEQRVAVGNQTVQVKSASGSGFGAHLEAGVELLRSNHVGARLSVRVDAPFYALEGETNYAPKSTYDDSYGYGSSTSSGPSAKTTRSLYVVPVAINFGFTFQ